MAKRFKATIHEIEVIMDGDLSLNDVREDWYRQCFVVNADDLLGEPLNLEFPLNLPRDQFGSPIIPGGITAIEGSDVIDDLKACLGIDQNADYIFSVLSGKYYRPHDDDPARFTLIDPRRARDVMLMASWPHNTKTPDNPAEDEICQSPVLRSAIFDEDGRGYCLAVWIIRALSPLGERLIAKARQEYVDSIQASTEYYKHYVQNCATVREDLWQRLDAMAGKVSDGEQIIAVISCEERYVHLEWYSDEDGHCSEYHFYTDVGAISVVDFATSAIKKKNATFAVFKNF